jgi:hypothetical protein
MWCERVLERIGLRPATKQSFACETWVAYSQTVEVGGGDTLAAAQLDDNNKQGNWCLVRVTHL